MDLIFNELSFYHKPKNERQGIEILNNFVNVCKKAKQLKFSKLQAENTFLNETFIQDISILVFLNKPDTRRHRSFLLSYIRKPYLTENGSIADDSFILNNYFLHSKAKKAQDLLEIEVTGLAYAYLYDTIAVSLCTSSTWDKPLIKIDEKNDETNNIFSVRHICKLEHFENHKEWIEDQQPIVAIKTKIKPENKTIKLREDHGKDILQAFSKKLRQSGFVIKIINSLPFNPKEQNFVKQCYPNGQIELVLTKTDKGIGIIVQTTGRNLKETEFIAKKLWDKYYN